MTDTRKEFEEAMKVLPEFRLGDFYVFSGMSLQWKSWQACQSLNDKRIQQLLALIAKKDEALQEITTLHGSTTNFGVARYIATNALAIKPENVELVEVGYISDDGQEVFLTMGMPIDADTCGVPVDNLYTIKKTKEST